MTVVDKDERDPLMPLRTAVVLIAALLCGGLVGALAYLAGDNLPAATIVGLAALAGAVGFFHGHIGRG
ncbi:hypothetical protein [Actinosynnema pretiosum]|uniref:Uncharacterized protein n=1 Tax=Actinosynnema pretiosum TaxID=42197 RepID=A0A290Z107_9PSEU|nr:hypothetical protein [Actinosynnema pretiosum]ATE52721.1 hypothetical protein CNX65_04990 [Actinosynnema pretiosum]